MTVKARSLACPNCGGAVELRGFAHTLTAVCPQCLSVLDAATAELQILQTFQGKERIQPKIPLGAHGKIAGTDYQIIGFQVREVATEDDVFSWDEYLLFNPYKGFRYLTEYQGHWNFVRVMTALPVETTSRGKRAMRIDDRTFLHFDSMTAKTAYVLGEFPWQVRVNDSALCQDFIAPPYMLSSESTAGEVTWSSAEYVPGAELWRAFQVPGPPPARSGIFANQPSPYAGKAGSAWRTWLWLNVALLAVAFYFMVFSAKRTVFSESYTFVSGKGADAAFVTPDFELAGRDSNVQLAIHTNVENDWIYFGFALINAETGQAFDFGREVSYYHDSDGNEGSPNDTVIIPTVPSGKYYLRVEPEMAPSAPYTRYELELHRDVPNFSFFWLAGALLLIPPVITSVRAGGFEAARWRESDYAPSVSTSSDDGDDGGDD